MLTCLTSYLCKPEHHMIELIKTGSKEAFKTYERENAVYL